MCLSIRWLLVRSLPRSAAQAATRQCRV